MQFSLGDEAGEFGILLARLAFDCDNKIAYI